MMDLSKKLNSQDMIQFAQIFCQQPRNTVRPNVSSPPRISSLPVTPFLAQFP